MMPVPLVRGLMTVKGVVMVRGIVMVVLVSHGIPLSPLAARLVGPRESLRA
jgi:hypothetical protein